VVIEGGDVTKATPSGRFETTAACDGNLFEGLQTIGCETGTDDIDTVYIALAPPLEAIVEIWTKPRFAAES
jgi:hypothetical protein